MVTTLKGVTILVELPFIVAEKNTFQKNYKTYNSTYKMHLKSQQIL